MNEAATPHDAVVAANQAFYRAFNQKDAAAMDALWAKSTPVSCIHPGWNVLVGRAEVVQSWTNILTNPNQPRIVSGGESVQMIGGSPGAALVTCRELVAGTPLAATNVFVWEADAWRLVHHQSGPVSLQAP